MPYLCVEGLGGTYAELWLQDMDLMLAAGEAPTIPLDPGASNSAQTCQVSSHSPLAHTHLNLLFPLTKSGRVLSSMSAWDSASLGPRMVVMVICGPTQLLYCLTLQR